MRLGDRCVGEDGVEGLYRWHAAKRIVAPNGEVSAMHALDVSRVQRTGMEYRSRAEVNGLPVVHVSFGGFDRIQRPRVARGLFAFGDVAIGLVAVGGLAIAPLSFGGIAIGLLALGGLAAGVVALAGVAVGLVAAGAVAFGVTAFGEVTVSAAAAPWLRRSGVGFRPRVAPAGSSDQG